MTLKIKGKSVKTKATHKQPDELFREAVCTTTKLILDNSTAGSPKIAIVSMWQNEEGPVTFVEDYLPGGELGIADISSLGIAVTRFEVSWKRVGETHWHTTGLSATPGNSYTVIGIRWDQYDNATLIAH